MSGDFNLKRYQTRHKNYFTIKKAGKEKTKANWQIERTEVRKFYGILPGLQNLCATSLLIASS